MSDAHVESHTMLHCLPTLELRLLTLCLRLELRLLTLSLSVCAFSGYELDHFVKVGRQAALPKPGVCA